MKVTLMATFVVAKIQKQLLCKLNCKNRYYLRRNIFEEEAEKHPRTSRQAGPGNIGYKNMILFCRMDAICCFSSGALIGLDIYPSNPFSSTLCSSDA